MSAILFSCDNSSNEKKTEKDAVPPAKPGSVVASSDYGEIILKWTKPADEDFDYTLVEFTRNGKDFSLKVRGDSILIDGFSDTAPYEFSLYSVDFSQNRSEAAKITATPDVAPNSFVFDGIKTSPLPAGARISWINPTEKMVSVSVKYTDDSDAEQTAIKTSVKLADSFEIAVSNRQNIEIAAIYGASRLAKSVEIVPLPPPPSKLDRTGWDFPGYDDGSQGETIGYSSQATNEGGTPNGRVIAMIDGSTSTFWHASWSPASSYPHWFIVDMHQSIAVYEIELQRRQGNGGTAKGFRLYTCKDVPVDQNDPNDGYDWEDQGEYPFDPTINDAQRISIPASPVARYIKMYFDVHHKGTGNFAMFSEFAVWGIDNQ